LNLYVAHVWAGTDDKELFAQMQEWNLLIKQRFAAEKIEFAYPTQTVHLKTEAAAK
jgi:small-conductance mechanosensitive channel